MLEDLIPQREFSFPDENLSVHGFFQGLVHRFGPALAEHLLPGGRFHSHYAFLVNGIHINNLKGMVTLLENGDEVSVFTLVAGG